VNLDRLFTAPHCCFTALLRVICPPAASWGYVDLLSRRLFVLPSSGQSTKEYNQIQSV